MAYWLIKTEPGEFSWDDLVRDRKTSWDGVRNPTALKNIRSMNKGDLALIYHTGSERSAIGVAEIISQPYAERKDPRLVAVDIKPVKKLPHAVSLDQIKADKTFEGWILLRIGRLSIVPTPPAMWKRIVQIAGQVG